jgi:hypothetical protein
MRAYPPEIEQLARAACRRHLSRTYGNVEWHAALAARAREEGLTPAPMLSPADIDREVDRDWPIYADLVSGKDWPPEMSMSKPYQDHIADIIIATATR